MKTRLIGLVGHSIDPHGNTSTAGAGKSTVAGYLWEKHDFVEMCFADRLKRACRDLFGMTEEQLWGPSEARSIPTPSGIVPRKALQLLGTELGRVLDPDVWVKSLIDDLGPVLLGVADYDPTLGIVGTQQPVPGVVVSDVRFKNEFDALKELGAKMVLIRRTVSYDIEPSNHQSEVDLGPFSAHFDGFIHNNGEFKDLHRSIDSVLQLFNKNE